MFIENPSVFVKTLGCKVNTFDTHVLENQFRSRGFHVEENWQATTINVINSCSVTSNAEKEARYWARRFRRENPNSTVIVTGCYAQTDSARVASLDEVDVVVPNEVKEKLVDVAISAVSAKTRGESVARIPEGVKAVSENRQEHFKSSLTFFDRSESLQTRAFIKIQDGCNGFCTYCLIPYARGASRSVPSDVVVEEISRLTENGVREVVITGIHVGDYGSEWQENEGARELPKLLRKLFALPNLARLRISSLEPSEVTPELMEVLAEHREKVCDHFHLPLQSGCNEILKKMRRTYTAERYLDSVQQIREVFPDAAIGADVIPGFPGETDEQFAETMRFLQRANIHYLHVFPYSKRPNTAAAKMPGHLDPSTIDARVKELRSWSANAWKLYRSQFVGRPLEVLWEKDLDSQNRRVGITRNYLQVAGHCAGDALIPGSLNSVLLKGFVEGDRLLGLVSQALH